ncbi:conserved hypothetical protein [Xenorhabdus cabanillasii JM26]|uniref:Uncharacterized protein n=1 Tax=Xenorhabdus cabanillasii JM26 TaxID=1427517 RepID=W1IV58_9GAMM|nr:conserved hypothetical protein [Xenorhabdus cabanillasii JM26]
MLRYVISFPILYTPVIGVNGYANALKVNKKVINEKLNPVLFSFSISA